MREIKFRAIPRYTNMCRDELKEMPQYDETFIYGYLIDNYIVGDVIEATDEYISLEYWVPIKKETASQYTGLKDKHGVEIYEGDICTGYGMSANETGVVAYDELECLYAINKNPLQYFVSGTATTNPKIDIEIIGNIYESPELLEAK